MRISKNQINAFDHLYRINIINCCSGYKSANLIGTKSPSNITNVAIFSSVIHLGSNPPLLGFILRPPSVPRHTYLNIKSTGYFTINHIDQSILKEAHHTSAKYKADISEFDKTNLEAIYTNNFYAPFVKDAPLQIAMKYVEEYHIKANNVIMIVGEIQDIYVQDDLLENDGFINLSKGNVATINGLDGYSIPNLKERFEYQRPKNS